MPAGLVMLDPNVAGCFLHNAVPPGNAELQLTALQGSLPVELQQGSPDADQPESAMLADGAGRLR